MSAKRTGANEVLADLINHTDRLKLRAEVMNLASVYLEQKDIEKLRKLYGTWRATGAYIFTTDHIGLYLTVALDLAGKHREADELICQLKKNPGWISDTLVLERLSDIYTQRKDIKSLLVLAREADNPQRLVNCKDRIHARLAWCYHKVGQEREANKEIASVLAKPHMLKNDFGSLQLLTEIFLDRKDKGSLSKLFHLTNSSLFVNLECARASIGLRLAKVVSDEPAEARKILHGLIAELEQSNNGYLPAKRLLEAAKGELASLNKGDFEKH
jgi:hypothetical protein